MESDLRAIESCLRSVPENLSIAPDELGPTCLLVAGTTQEYLILRPGSSS